MRKTILFSVAFFALIILILDAVAGVWHLYYSLWWWDMVMHFLGGAWIVYAGTFLFLKRFRRLVLERRPWRLIVLVLGLVLLAAIGWEIFEFSIQGFAWRGDWANPVDSVSDIFWGLAGGAIALGRVLRKYLSAST